MNTDKTLDNEFANSVNKRYPIWYYKELKETTIDYVIFSLLKEKFVVDINGVKHEITFGKNKKHEIWFTCRYDELSEGWLCSYEVIEKGFREGKWYTTTDVDTSDEFKANYNKKKEEYEEKQHKQFCVDILTNAIELSKNLSKQDKEKALKELEKCSNEELKELVDKLFSKINKE